MGKRIGNLVKYRRGKIIPNIFKYVIDIPLPSKIFSTCFWTSCILGKKCEGGRNRKQRLGVGHFLNPPTRRSEKEIPRNSQVWKAVGQASK
jgi:hypothetical protein